jgi:hypothetical protein
LDQKVYRERKENVMDLLEFKVYTGESLVLLKHPRGRLLNTPCDADAEDVTPRALQKQPAQFRTSCKKKW